MPRTLRLLVAAAVAACLIPAAADARPIAVNDGGRIVVDEYVDSGDLGRGAGRFTAQLAPAPGDELRLDGAFGRGGFRLEAPGDTPTPTFTTGRAVDIAGDGAVVIASSDPEDPDAAYVQRLLPGGRPDEAFGPGGIRPLDLGDDGFVVDAVVLGGGGVLVGGRVVPAEAGAGRRGPAIVALRSDGSLDPGFGSGGVATHPVPAGQDGGSAQSIGVLGDGRLLIGGDGAVARFEPDGDLDPAFGTGGVVTLTERWRAAPSGTGFLLARGRGTAGVEVQRRREDGTLDPAFSGDGRTVERLGAKEFDTGPGGEETGEQRFGGVSDLLARDGGGAVVAVSLSVRRSGDPEETVESFPARFAADGGLDGAAPAFRGHGAQLAPRPGGGVLVYFEELLDYCDCVPGQWNKAGVKAYDATGARVAERALEPVFSPAPDVRIASGPPNTGGSVAGPDARFAFEVTPAPGEPGAALECSLRDAPWGPCPADGRYAGLTEGRAVLRVRALGRHGARSAVRSYEWAVNHRAPTTTLTAVPPAVTRETSARIAFAADEPAGYLCRIDGAETQPCDSGVVELSGLADGFHQVTLRARDALGGLEAEPRVVSWTVDTRGSASFFTAVPARETRATDAAFAFGASEAGSRFECALDGAAFAACASPLRLIVAPGAHRFAVRAVDPAGNAGPEIVHAWSVDGPDTVEPKPPGPIVEPDLPGRISIGKVTQLRDGRYRVRLRANVSGRARVRATVLSGRRAVLAASRTFRLRAGKARTVTLRLNARGRRALRTAQRPRVRITAALTGTPGGRRTVPAGRR